MEGFGEFKFRLWGLTGRVLGVGPKVSQAFWTLGQPWEFRGKHRLLSEVGWTSLPSSGTWPSARQAGAAEADSSGRFWIFGGRTKQRRCLLIFLPAPHR